MTDRDVNGRFKPGISGNPEGKKKDSLSVSALIDEAVTPDDWKFIIQQLLKRAKRGDLKAIEMLMDRRFGKALQQIDGTVGVTLEWTPHKQE